MCNGRQRMHLKHFVEHMECILKISYFNTLKQLGFCRFGWIRRSRVKRSQKKTRHRWHTPHFHSLSAADAITNLQGRSNCGRPQHLQHN
ncbi:hypothetical protein DVH24_038760 [Malus domestica]|uniref:Uncharacterized protein n=1 Tax=Malus domestica TaxID=3750 RepID=A0A498KAV6_MALDO|nr:hypothetical protein DVH24_038760 [Malus domestica]